MCRTLLVSLCFVINTHQVIACSCFEIKSFCESVTFALQWDSSNTLVARGQFVEEVFVNQYCTDLIFEVNESYHNTRHLTSVRIMDGNGADCGRSLMDYQIGDELIIQSHIWFDTMAFGQFNICYPAPLRVKGKQVEGRILSEKEERMTLSKFVICRVVVPGNPFSVYIRTLPPTSFLLRYLICLQENTWVT